MPGTLLATTLALALAIAGCSHASGSAMASAPAPAAARAPATPAAVTTAAIAMGDSLFNTGSCQRCHGQKGIGANNGPSLVEGPWLHSTGSFDEIVATITSGVAKETFKVATRRFAMNPRGGPMNLSDDQIRTVAAYVWSISRNRK